jgi:hypothetical protein
MQIFRTYGFSSLISLCFLVQTSIASATDCSSWSQFSSSNQALAALSVPIASIQDHLNGLPTSEGVIFDVELKQRELWVDVVYVPDQATAISGLRAMMQMGRLVQGDFDRVVFSDDIKGVYQIPEPILREIGCQFIWGQEGGQNPIYLIRFFFENLEFYPNGEKAVNGFTGHLLGDTSRAMDYHTAGFVPAWMLTALQ